MKRIDHAKAPRYAIGTHISDEVRTELEGTQYEASIVVEALQLLVLERKKQQLLTGYDTGVHPVEQLLASIAEPNYVEDALQQSVR